ncbi:MAG: hypothetical protein AAGA91_12665 [Pseudomonadota bacterium]
MLRSSLPCAFVIWALCTPSTLAQSSGQNPDEPSDSEALPPISLEDENEFSKTPFDPRHEDAEIEEALQQRYGDDRLLPLFRGKAMERGIFLPWPLGVSVAATRFTERLQLDSLDIKLGNGAQIDSGLFNTLIDPEDIEVTNYSIRFDAWVLPFLNVFALAGKTTADLNIEVSDLPGQSFDRENNTYGVGVNLAAGFGVMFSTLELRYTQTDFSFSPDGAQLLTTIFRAGWNGQLGDFYGSAWIGALRQDFDLSLEVNAGEFPALPPVFQSAEVELDLSSSRKFTPSMGTRWDISKHWEISVEYSFDERNYLTANLGYRY